MRKHFILALFLFAFTVKVNCFYFEVDKDLEDQYETIEDEIIEYAKYFIGTEYKFGGKTPEAFDCSGFVHYVFNEFGIRLPISSKAMSTAGKNVSLNELQKGDLVFFEGRVRQGVVAHVGIVCGTNENNETLFIHASSSKNITIAVLKGSYFMPRFICAKRIDLDQAYDLAIR